MNNPWVVTEETKRMAESNLVLLLDSFLNCFECKFVLFSWIFRSEEIFNDWLKSAGREKDKIAGYIESFRSCEKTDSMKIDTTKKSIDKVSRILNDRSKPREYRKA